MKRSQARLIAFVVFSAFFGLLVGAVWCGLTLMASAVERPWSDVELKKIDGWIAGKGHDVAVSALITDILGLTDNDRTISCRAFGAVDSASGNEIHQIYLLPDLKGYLVDHFHQDKVDVYWIDKDLVLVAALSGVRGEKPAPTSFQEAQFSFKHEMAWWAAYADAN